MHEETPSSPSHGPSVLPPSKPGLTMLEVLDWIDRLEQDRGHKPMSETEMAAEIERMRAGDAEYEQRCREIAAKTQTGKPVRSGA